MEFDAHKREMPDGEIRLQTVQEHLKEAADRAAECLRCCGLPQAAWLAGMLHDMGKFSEEFQNYLLRGIGAKGTVIHSFQGCRLLLERYHDSTKTVRRLTAELLAFAVGAHHGLFDCVDEARKVGLRYRMEKENLPYEDAKAAFFAECMDPPALDQCFDEAAGEIGTVAEQLDEAYESDEEYYFSLGLLARLLLSAVIEGDRRDTARFMNDTEFPQWQADLSPVWRERLVFLENKLAELPSDSPVARARTAISDQCKAFAAEQPGIYRLSVPTGGGKTLASLRYALTHGATYHKKRIIFTSPLLSILEQNARVIREYVGDDRLILEHHSNVVQTDGGRDELDRRELMTQSWDAPMIITTMVQLLHTLFDGKTTAIRRFWALCDSVIVIDEVQTVPTKLLSMFNLALRFLSEQCGATIILCSATQPTLEYAAHPLRQMPRDMVPYDPALWRAFERTVLKPLPPTRLEQMPELIRNKMEDTDSLLVICNTKSEAAKLFSETTAPEYRSYHLSAAMCMQHRRDRVEEIRAALAHGEKLLCISTQVMEAGVDISFRRVLRLMAGMDSIVQSAGRCNRNGESKEPCPVYMVNCTDENLSRLRDILRGKTATTSLLEAYRRQPERFDGSLSSDRAIRQYYLNYYGEMEREEQDGPIASLQTTLLDLLSRNTKYADGDCTDAEDFILRQAFAVAGQYFTVFDQDTVDVLVPYGRGKTLIEELGSARSQVDPKFREARIREAASYTVSLYAEQRKALEAQHGLFSVCGGSVLVLGEWYYDEALGLTIRQNALSFLEV